MERAVITLQKMQRKRVLSQRIEPENRFTGIVTSSTERAAITLQKMQRKRILGRSVEVRKFQSSDTASCCMQAASVLAVTSKVSPILCVM